MTLKSKENKLLIETFYEGFKHLDAEVMARCYHPNIFFSDSVFISLEREMPANMWRMLCQRLRGSHFKFSCSNVWANDNQGGCSWEAEYYFSSTGNLVHNKITAQFKFRDGKIIEHCDNFSFWRWSRMALGIPGYLLGWTSFLKNKVRNQAMEGLEQFVSERQINSPVN